MTYNTSSEDPFNREYYLSVFLKFIIYLSAGFLVGQLMSAFVYMFYFGEDLSVMAKAIAHPEDNLGLGMPLLLVQAANSLVCFLIFPLMFISKTSFPIHYNSWQGNPQVAISSFSNVFLMMIFVLPLSGILAEWNQSVQFPEFLSGFESWARSSEKQIAALTQVITHFESLTDFLVGLLIIGVLAAVGEELAFRGVLQPLFIHLFKNAHLGIWVTAFVFGAIHMQFFSFLPRFVLGIIFGYMYFYSQNLWVPIVGHFVNNGLSLFFVYRYGMSESDLPLKEVGQNQVMIFLFSVGLISVVFIYLKRMWAKNRVT